MKGYTNLELKVPIRFRDSNYMQINFHWIGLYEYRTKELLKQLMFVMAANPNKCMLHCINTICEYHSESCDLHYYINDYCIFYSYYDVEFDVPNEKAIELIKCILIGK